MGKASPQRRLLNGLRTRMRRLLSAKGSGAATAERPPLPERQAWNLESLTLVAHELRTPLQSILGLQSLLKHTSPNSLQERYIDMSMAAGRHLLDLIQGILEKNPHALGLAKPGVQVFSLRSLLDACLETVSPLAHAKGLELHGIVPSEVEDTWLGDELALRQILINLLGNAIQFTRQGEVTLRILAGALSAGQQTLGFQISDTGPGMTPEEVARLFQSDPHADWVGAPRLNGYGLPICQKLAQNMGGEMECRSEWNRGTDMVAWIPLYQAPQVREPHLQVLPNKVILVASHSPHASEALAHSLRFLGCQVVISPSDAATLSGLVTGRWDDTVLDAAVCTMNPAWECDKEWSLASHFFRAQSLPQLWLNPNSELFPIADRPPHQRMVHHLGALSTALLRQEMAGLLHDDGIEEKTDSMAQSLNPGWKGSILLIEDDPVHSTVAMAMLQKLEYDVQSAVNGAEGLRFFSLRNFDAVLMDCFMEKLDGYQTTQFIRGLESGDKRTPIIGMTAKTGPDSLQQALAAGMDDVLTKPFELEEMSAKLSKWMPMPGNQTHVDLNRLTRILRGLKGKHLAERLLRVYQKAAEAEMQHIDAALPQRKIADILRAAHKLAGSSSTLGAHQLTSLARSMESSIETGDWDRVHRIWEDMQSEFSEATSALKKGIEAWYP
jgi:two-component system, sensor histidine kinase and response regulator